jgi:hypothetical protein
MSRRALAALAFLLPTATARGQRVQLAPFAGLQYGGSVQAAAGGEFTLNASLAYGATLDVPFDEGWSVEVLYSRDETRLHGPGPGVDVRVERYMAGVVQEHDHGRTRFFGVGLAGATRLVPPAGYGSSARFTLAAGLGVKRWLSDRIALRAEARGFYTVTESNGGLFCGGGGCLFVYGSSGLLQGDLAAGVVLAF